jgi:D-alanyl-lipoteichoic acid acyltransferase DltB (MBOAT superfamily)
LPRLSSTFITAWTFRVLAWVAIAWLVGWPGLMVLAGAALAAHAAALVIRRLHERPAAATAVLALATAAGLTMLVAALRPSLAGFAAPLGVGVFFCHAVSYMVDVRRGRVDPRPHGAALLYMVQLPVFPAGPLSRFGDFRQQLARTDVAMGGFSYGVRRIVQGLTKVYLIAGPLGARADEIFALPVTRLSTDTAWLGAACASLDVYFYLSGFSDVGIGLAKILGFRLLENFRRPYTADSIREFWRRWNVTLITWLRDYAGLPIAGHESPTLTRYLVTIMSFVLVGLWYRPTLRILPWAVYTASWLAAEALGVGRLIERLPRALRHAYVLLVVMFGWMLLRAQSPGPLLGYVESMIGLSVADFGGSLQYLTLGTTTALVCALVFAGPMVSSLSRWRVSVDAATASLIMMLAATGVFIWKPLVVVRRLLQMDQPPRPR